VTTGVRPRFRSPDTEFDKTDGGYTRDGCGSEHRAPKEKKEGLTRLTADAQEHVPTHPANDEEAQDRRPQTVPPVQVQRYGSLQGEHGDGQNPDVHHEQRVLRGVDDEPPEDRGYDRPEREVHRHVPQSTHDGTVTRAI